MNILLYIIGAVAAFGAALMIYRSTNKGLSDRSLHQQTTRYAVGALLSMLPLACSGGRFRTEVIVMAAVTSLLWMVTYPLLFHLTNRKAAAEYDHKMDEAMGLYLFGILSAVECLSQGQWLVVDVLMTLVGIVFLVIPLLQIGWWAIYRTCVDANGIQIVQQTNVNEGIEYVRSFSMGKRLLMAVPTFGVPCAYTYAQVFTTVEESATSLWQAVMNLSVFFFLLRETLRPPQGNAMAHGHRGVVSHGEGVCGAQCGLYRRTAETPEKTGREGPER